MRFGRAPERDEFEYYNEVSATSVRDGELTRLLTAAAAIRGDFADPIEPWLDTYYDSVAQADIYRHVRPKVIGGDVLQMGGTGKEVLKMLMGGASRGYLVTPVEGEAELTRELARRYDVADRFEALVGFGEDLPLGAGSVDVVVSESCLHHTDVSSALRETSRVLRSGGRFGAWDPWHARLYNIGVSIFGKREPGIECRPLNPDRMSSLHGTFPDAEIRLHGAIVRYPLIAAGKFGWWPKRSSVHRWTLLDDKVSAHSKVLSRNGSSVAVLATKR